MDTKEDQFIKVFQVGDKEYKIDALLVFADMAMSSEAEGPTNEQIILSIKRALRPQSLAETLTDQEAFALSLRVSLSLKNLGKDIAP